MCTHTKCVEVHSKKIIYIYNLIYVWFMLWFMFISLQRSGAASVLMFRLLISGASIVWRMGSRHVHFSSSCGHVGSVVAPMRVGSCWTRDQTQVPSLLAWSFHTVEDGCSPVFQKEEKVLVCRVKARRPPPCGFSTRCQTSEGEVCCISL